MSYITNLGKNKREQLKSRMDDFTSFRWANRDMFEEFGAFIVGGKDALKFYNGSNFTNQYAKPQFEGASPLLTGVNFDIQKIEFTMGVYWFTIEEYRKLLNVLHPYEVNDLKFGFSPHWRYYVKLNSYKDSTRNFLGYDSNGQARYYTEIKLTFEVQGDSCAKACSQYDLKLIEADDTGSYWRLLKYQIAQTDYTTASDLETPFQFTFNINLQQTSAIGLYPREDLFPDVVSLFPEAIATDSYDIHINALMPLADGLNYNRMGLCSMSLNYLSSINNTNELTFTYHSDTGLLTLKHGDTQKIMSLLSSAGTGTRMLQALETTKCYLPGVLTQGISAEQFYTIQFEVIYSRNLAIDGLSLVSYGRTNVI